MFTHVEGDLTYIYTGAREIVPSQPSVVFIHGGGLDHTVWISQSRYFAHHGCNALAIDLPEHGRSEGATKQSIEAMADWVVACLDALGVAEAHVVGHSMGSLAALETAGRHPERVSSLSLLGISIPMPVTEQLLSAAKADDHAAFDMINLWGHGYRSQLGGNQAPGMWMTGGGIRLLERAKPGVLHNDLKACNNYQRGLESAAKVKCPTHLILGKTDAMSPTRSAKAVTETLANPLVTQLDCGHMLMSERPREVQAALASSILASKS